MSLTITIPGAVNVTTGAMAPAVLTIGVGVPGAAGPAGPAGPGVPAGGTAGQYLQKIDGVNYNTDWVTLNLGAYAPLNSPLFTGDPRGPTAALGDNDTSIATTAFVQQELLSGTANAKNLEVYVRNQTGSTIPAGAIVYINGATGNRPTITLAQANNDANSAQTFGFTKAAIANNGFGYVIVRGECEALDTSSLTEGVQLYLSPTTPGTWTTTKPSAPQHLVYVGICVRAHPTQGVIMVAVQNGYELPELHDVSITSVANNDLLAYESSSTLWKNKSFGTLGLLTSSSLTGYATQSFVAANYAPIAAGLPVSGTVGQVLTKNSGTNYDASWQTLIPGDRYLTTSTSSVTIGLGSKSLTVGTGLSYSGQQDVVISFDASNHMHALVTSYNSGTGALVVNVQSFSGSGTYTAWTVNVGGTTPLQSVEWGEILGTLGDQSDLASALNGKLESTTAASTYAALAGATFTGEVVTPASTTSNAGLTITPGVAPTSPVNGELWATSTDLQVRLNGTTETIAEQSWVTAGFYPLTGNPSGFLTSASLSGYALLSGATFTGLVTTPAATTTTAGLNLPHGAAPTTPVNGDVWTTTSGLFMRQNGVTKQYVDFDTSQTINGNKTFSNATSTFGSSTATGTIGLASGATISGSTKTLNIGTGGVSGSTTTITIGSGNGTTTTFNGTLNAGGNVSLGTFTGATTVNLANGATTTGLTKTVNVGTGGLAGSTTTIAIGSSAGTSTTTLQGTTNGVTAAADTNSVALATTAYVVGQAGSDTPLVDGTAAVGTSLRYARQDHVHPTDTTRLATANNLSELTATASTARTNIGLGTISTVNDAPSDGSTYGRNNGAWVVAGGGGGGASTDYQAYTTPGTFTWTKPANAKFVDLIMWGGGGGGGSGARQATSSGRSGGGGGGGGGYLVARLLASSLGSTQSVTVGAGGTGGAAVTTDTTIGNNGGNGGNSVFFNLTVLGAGGGVGGGTTASSGTGGGGRTGYLFGSAVPRTSGNGAIGTIGAGGANTNVTTADAYLTSSGGAGAGAGAGSTTSASGSTGSGKSALTASASGLTTAVSAAAGGTTAGVPAVAGISGVTIGGGGTGGGGGAYITNVAGMAGAAGGFHGGAGGGGAASDNGFASGAGGNGGGGAVYIITYC